MRKHGGFEHNRQSLRIVEELEQKYPDFPGLNLTWEVREGLVKHYTAYDHPGRRKGFDAKNSSLEAQIANLADEITYYSHDLDDGLDSGLLSEKQLAENVRFWALAARRVKNQFGALPDEARRYFTIRTIIDMQIRDVVQNSELLICRSGVQSADEVRSNPKALIAYSPKLRELILELRKYLYENLYFYPSVRDPNLRAGEILEKLFKYYLAHPKEIGSSSQKRATKIGLHRAVCDYVAGMTDRYTIDEYQRIFQETFKLKA